MSEMDVPNGGRRCRSRLWLWRRRQRPSSSSSDHLGDTFESIRSVAVHMEKAHCEGKRIGLFSFWELKKRERLINRSAERRAGQVARPRRRSIRLSLPLQESIENLGVDDGGLRASLATALLINLISIGYLSLPYAFARAGTVLSTIGFALIILQAFITGQYVLEACARAHFLAEASARMEVNASLGGAVAQALSDLKEEHDVSMKALAGTSAGQSANRSGASHGDTTGRFTPDLDVFDNDDRREAHKLSGRFKAELPELCRLFLGPQNTLFFLACISLDLYGLTWSYASIFANGMNEMIPLPLPRKSGYLIFILIFAVIVIPLSCAQISDSIMLQLVFLFGRMAMFLLMIATVTASWVSGTAHFDDFVGPSNPSVPLFRFRSLYLLLQISIFSTAYQFAVPGIADASANKGAMNKVCAVTCTFIFVTVLINSLVLSTFFGVEHIEASSNMNWIVYHGGTGEIIEDDDGTATRINTSYWAKAISGYVTIFPAIDAIAVFPLCAISLGEILMGAWYGGQTTTSMDWKKRTIFRLLGSTPQIVGAAFVADLNVIADYAGLFTTFAYSVCPALLYIYSGKALRKLGVADDTVYKTPFSRDCVAGTICVTATAVAVYALANSVHDEVM